MKKLVTILTLSLLSIPAFACPNMDHDNDAPKTADQKDAPKKEEAPKPDTAKKTDAKAPDKVADAGAKKTADPAPAKK